MRNSSGSIFSAIHQVIIHFRSCSFWPEAPDWVIWTLRLHQELVSILQFCEVCEMKLISRSILFFYPPCQGCKKCNWKKKNLKKFLQGWNGKDISMDITDCVKISLNSCYRKLMPYSISMSGLTTAKNISHTGTKSFSFYQLKVESMLLKKIIYMFGPETPLCSLQYQTR